MIDAITQEPLRIQTAASGRGSILQVPVSQLEEVRRLLDSHHVPYWVLEHFISYNGEPEVAFVVLASAADPQTVQTILDSVR